MGSNGGKAERSEITFIAGVIQRQREMVVGFLVDVIVALGAQEQDGDDDH